MILCAYWGFAIVITIVIWVLVLDFSTITGPERGFTEGKVLTSALNKKRKLFHALAVFMFVPGVLCDVSSLCPSLFQASGLCTVPSNG